MADDRKEKNLLYGIEPEIAAILVEQWFTFVWKPSLSRADRNYFCGLKFLKPNECVLREFTFEIYHAKVLTERLLKSLRDYFNKTDFIVQRLQRNRRCSVYQTIKFRLVSRSRWLAE